MNKLTSIFLLSLVTACTTPKGGFPQLSSTKEDSNPAIKLVDLHFTQPQKTPAVIPVPVEPIPVPVPVEPIPVPVPVPVPVEPIPVARPIVSSIAVGEKKVTLEGTNFAVGSKELLSSATGKLDDVANFLLVHLEIKLNVVGHTDNRGNKNFNQKLSENRAASIKSYLVSKGVSIDRIKTSGAGSNQAIADNKTSTGRAKNRRVELNFID